MRGCRSSASFMRTKIDFQEVRITLSISSFTIDTRSRVSKIDFALFKGSHFTKTTRLMSRKPRPHVRLLTCSGDETHLKMPCSEKSWGAYTLLRQKCCDRSSVSINLRNKKNGSHKTSRKARENNSIRFPQCKKLATCCAIIGDKPKYFAKSSTKSTSCYRVSSGRRTLCSKIYPWQHMRLLDFKVAVTTFCHVLSPF